MSRVAPAPPAPLATRPRPPPRRAPPPPPPPPRPAVSRRALLLSCAWFVVPSASSAPAAALPTTSPRPGPEFEDVAFPRYPGFTTFPSGVQARDLCLGDGPEVVRGRPVRLEWAAWTVHRGRKFSGPLGTTPALSFVPGDGALIPALEEAVLAGMRAGGVRRVLVPPKASVSYPYVPPEPLPDGITLPAPRTKLGRAPVGGYDPALGTQRVDRGVGPAPADPADRDWLESVIDRNAFTIKPADRSLLFDVRVLAVGGGPSDDDAGFADANNFANENDRGVDPVGNASKPLESFGVVNDASGDGGASWWTATLPGRSTYCPAER